MRKKPLDVINMQGAISVYTHEPEREREKEKEREREREKERERGGMGGREGVRIEGSEGGGK